MAVGTDLEGEHAMTELSAEAKNLNWLVQSFAEKVPGVNEAVVVSSDGLPIAGSAGLDRDAADRFAAVASGLIGLAYRPPPAAFGGGAVNEVIIEMENAFPVRHRHQRRLVPGLRGQPPSPTSGLVAYEMAVLVEKAGAVLTPELRAELQSALPEVRT